MMWIPAIDLNVEFSPTLWFSTAWSVMIAILYSWLNFFRHALLSGEANYPSSVGWIVNTLFKYIPTYSPGLGNALRHMKITRIRNH